MCNYGQNTHKILDLLRNIQGGLKCHMVSSAENFGLTVTQFMIMYEIYNHKYISLNELCIKLDLPKSSVSRIVDQLVNKGVILREIPKDNRRTVKLSMVEEFLKTIEISKINNKLNEVVTLNIEPNKCKRIISVLEELNSILTCEKK